MARRQVKAKSAHVGGLQMPLFDVESSWEPLQPCDWPDLKDAKFIGIDVEGHDPNLRERGPGYIRGDASMCGVSLATEYGFKTYLPYDHKQGGNLPKDQVLAYVRDQLKRPNQIKVGANLMYEHEALDSEGIKIVGPTYDIQTAGPLLNEEQEGGYSLENLSLLHLGISKTEDKLKEAAITWGLDPKRDLHIFHSKYVGEYGEDDAYLPIKVIEKQLPLLEKEGLNKVWDLECKLQPVLWKMRKHGVRIDLERVAVVIEKVKTAENKLLSELRQESEISNLDPWSSASLVALFEKMGLKYLVRYTAPTKNYPEGQASFTNSFFDEIGEAHPVCAKLVEYRNTNKMRRDFFEAMLTDFNVNGRLHAQWHALRADDEDRKNGTKTGRVASSKPNLTQVPARHPVWGNEVRSMFLPDEGGKWCKNDFSSQEPRLTVHFAYIKNYPGAAEARQRYLDDIRTDYHQMTADLILEKTGIDIGRKRAKTINLGAAYGMGFFKLARGLGVEDEAAREILKAYHAGVPFIKKLEGRCIELINGQGYIRTWLGRKRRFNMWEAADWKMRSFAIRDREEAIKMYGEVVRADAHKGLNAMVQGTAADQAKSAIVLLDEAGLTPQLMVHDELNQTIYSEESARTIQRIMENALEGLTVPHLAEAEVGNNWAMV